MAFCALQLATVLADARLQDRITGPGRATVTSVAGMGTDLAAIVVYAGYALVAAPGGHPVAFVAAAVPYLLVAGALAVPGSGRRHRIARRHRRRGEPAPCGRCPDQSGSASR